MRSLVVRDLRVPTRGSAFRPDCRPDVPLELTIAPAREAVWVMAAGEFDLAAVPCLRECVEELIDVGFEKVIVDLRGLTFIDVAGTRLLLELTGRAANDGWQLLLVCDEGPAWRTFTLTQTIEDLPLARTSHG